MKKFWKLASVGLACSMAVAGLAAFSGCDDEPTTVEKEVNHYIYVGYILRFLLPEICFSFFSMLYGWPVLGAIGKIKETTFSTILSALVQVAGIGLLIGMGWFNLISLAFCCGISEGVLLGIRLAIFQKNRALFHKADHMGLVSAGNG